uniref:Uncharacterized protein n=1 Tax=Setaria digitata TaxID=48799 RepID=A0A915Q4K3_9BILA
MAVNLLSCLLTIVVALLLKMTKRRVSNDANSVAGRASFYILIISAIFGVVPGGINGYAQRIQSDFIRELAFYVQLCASISGLSHAFIFGMAHRLIRRRIISMLKLGSFCGQQPRLSQNSVLPLTTLN